MASTLALAAAFVPGPAALALGGPAGGFVIPVGSVATFSNISFSACNSLSWGYQLSGGSNQVKATFPGGCGSGSAPNATIGPFATPTTFRVFLTDNRCGATYYSDGTPVDHVVVSGSNPFLLRFADSGGFCERRTTTFNTFGGCNFCVTLAITDQAITASGGSAVFTVEGSSVTAVVATFTDPDPAATAADYTAIIDWGDGNTSSGVITGTTTFSVSGTHLYGDEGTYTVSVSIVDADDSSNSATASSFVGVSDAVLAAAPSCAATTLGSYNGPTSTFIDLAGSSGAAADFTATINWGDGTTATGTVTATGVGSYLVTGVHNYGSTGSFTITTSIKDDGGSSATASCTTLGFRFAPGGGSFVVGGQHAGLGQSVTFWGAQWAKVNLSGGRGGPSSFKGFADNPASPTCGASWSGDTGNSAPPPAGPLPQFMGVIVTTSAAQSGAEVTGSTVHIVVVRTNPGYAPDPGHAGTGTVVAVVC